MALATSPHHRDSSVGALDARDCSIVQDDTIGNHVGMPAALLLDHWGLMIHEAFGTLPFLVGSATMRRAYRDVDVRVILDDAEFESWFPGSERAPGCVNPRWSAICASFSVWGEKMTGLPIDFQVQRRSQVSEADWEKARIPIGMFVRPATNP